MIKVTTQGTIPKYLAVSPTQIEEIIQQSLKLLQFSSDSLVEVNFASKKQIQTLNWQFRKKNIATDVLSFPQAKVSSNKITLLGTIVISAQMVREKNEKISDVLKHGLLHLLGFDHEHDETEWLRTSKIIDCQL